MKKSPMILIGLLIIIIACLLPGYFQNKQIHDYMTAFIIDKFYDIKDEMNDLNYYLDKEHLVRSRNSIRFIRQNLYLLGNDLHHYKYQISNNDNQDKELYALWENLSLFEDYFNNIDETRLDNENYRSHLKKELKILVSEHRKMALDTSNWQDFLSQHTAYRYGQ